MKPAAVLILPHEASRGRQPVRKAEQAILRIAVKPASTLTSNEFLPEDSSVTVGWKPALPDPLALHSFAGNGVMAEMGSGIEDNGWD